MESKIRLDKILLQKELAPSRERAQAYIMAGKVFVNNQKLEKPGTLVAIDAEIHVKGDDHPYVSRGGLKLEKAISAFDIDVNNRIAMDVGASTGGFTDCLLQHGCSFVFAIDVGYGQLDWKLATHSKVRNLEKKNFRYLTFSEIGTFVDVVVVDVSFISLTKILKNCFSFLAKGGQLIALIKPQFEAGRDRIGKKGIVKERDVHAEIIDSIGQFAREIGFRSIKIEPSPITGKKSGNIEYLAYMEKPITRGESA